MIKKILIANRGEIALRIIRTCKQLGIETVCIGTTAEKKHPHVTAAHHYKIFEELPYINQNLIIDVAKSFKVDAIHPGYGFLSENHHFAKLVEQEKIEFIGPSHQCLDSLGDKSKAKELANKLEIPTANSYIGPKLKEQAKKIGFPLLLKAVMGGGGRGMRKVENESEFDLLLEEVKKESARLYNNTDICLEEFIENPRHIEIQIAADKKGNTIHLFERDCSIQRRYQKVVEFCPAFEIKQSTLEKLYAYAIKICKESKLHNLATVEFLVAKDKIYFLEVNPRIQVEHPVTEEVTGLDLIKLQIDIANGKSIEKVKPVKKKQVVQARIYAESAINNYQSTSGRVLDLELSKNCRIDHSLFKGIKIDHNFDPMLAKLICSIEDKTNNSATKEKLRKKTLNFLNQTLIMGVETNLDLLNSIFNDKDIFRFTAKDLDKKRLALKNNFEIALALYHLRTLIQKNNLFNQNFRNKGITNQYFHRYYDKDLTAHKIKIQNIDLNKNTFEVKINKSTLILKIENVDNNSISFKVEQANHSAYIKANSVILDGYQYEIKNFKENITGKQNINLENKVTCKIPGKVINVLVKKGQEVEPNDTLLSIESMKIEHQIKSEKKAKIKKILVKTNQIVNLDDILIEYS